VVLDAGWDDEDDDGTEGAGVAAFGEALVGRGLHVGEESRLLAMSAWTWPRPRAT
jgi:hypothetical protein